MATAIDKDRDTYGVAFLDRRHEMSQGDYYYNMGHYYALGKPDGWKYAEPFAAAFVRHIRNQLLSGSYRWSVVDYYSVWLQENA